jgi:hypothetical protein
MAVKTKRRYVEGEEITAGWVFPRDDKPFHVTGIVRRTSPGTVGLEFVKITAYDKARILRFAKTQREIR